MAAVDATGRLALVGAASTLGREVKDALAASGVPGGRLALLDLDEHVGLVTDYGDEARTVLEATIEELREHALVCFAGAADTTRRFAPLVAEGGAVAIDCLGVCGGHRDAVLAAAARELPLPGRDRGAILLVPHPATQLLQRLAEALGERLRQAVVTLLLPATDTAGGAEELAAQAAAVLNFGDGPEQVFGRRLAFDVWPEGEPGVAARVCEELVALDLPVPALAALRVSVFHVLAANVWIEGLDADTARAALSKAGVDAAGPGAGHPAVDSPVRAAGAVAPTLGAVRELPDRGVYLWLLLDNTQAIAGRAVALARALLAQAERA